MKHFAFLLLTLQFMSTGLFAETINLEEARTLALLNSRSLARLNMSVQGRILDEKTQSFSNYPSLSMRVTAGTTLLDRDRGFSGDVLKDEFHFGVNAGVSQKLFDFDSGKTSILRSINNLNTESARMDALAEYYNVLNSVDSAYYSVLEAESGLEAAELSLESSELSLSIAEIRRQNRMLSDTDYLRALADKESRETSRNQARRDLSIAKIKFANMLGKTASIELEPVEFEPLAPLMQTLARIDDEVFYRLQMRFSENIRRKNPNIIKAGMSSIIAEKNFDSARKDYFPNLSAAITAGFSYGIDNGFSPNSVALSLNANIPLDFWVISTNLERRKMSLEQSVMDYRNALESLDIELQVCLLNLVSQAGQTLSSSRALEYSLLNFDQVQELYRLGQSSQSAMSDAEVMLRNNRNQYDRTRYSFLQALSSLRSLGAFDNGEEITILLSELRLE